jgi:hypothetical protein
VPPGRDGILDREIIIVGGLLPSLSSAVSTPAWFVLRNANRASVPVHPRGLEVGDFAGSKPESACDETDESRFEIVGRWEV